MDVAEVLPKVREQILSELATGPKNLVELNAAIAEWNWNPPVSTAWVRLAVRELQDEGRIRGDETAYYLLIDRQP